MAAPSCVPRTSTPSTSRSNGSSAALRGPASRSPNPLRPPPRRRQPIDLSCSEVPITPATAAKTAIHCENRHLRSPAPPGVPDHAVVGSTDLRRRVPAIGDDTLPRDAARSPADRDPAGEQVPDAGLPSPGSLPRPGGRENRQRLAEWITQREDNGFPDLQLDPATVAGEIVDGPPTLGSAMGIVFRAYAQKFEKDRWGDKRPSLLRLHGRARSPVPGRAVHPRDPRRPRGCCVDQAQDRPAAEG